MRQPLDCYGLTPIERREESLQFGEAERLLRKLKAAFIAEIGLLGRPEIATAIRVPN